MALAQHGGRLARLCRRPHQPPVHRLPLHHGHRPERRRGRPGEENPVSIAGRPLSATASTPRPARSTTPGTPPQRTGLHALDTAQVQLLAVPDAHALADAARRAGGARGARLLRRRGDCMFVGSAPDRGTRSGVRLARAPERLHRAGERLPRHGRRLRRRVPGQQGLRRPLRALDPGHRPDRGRDRRRRRFVPPDGHVMGVYARTELERGIWKAPAGDRRPGARRARRRRHLHRRPAHRPGARRPGSTASGRRRAPASWWRPRARSAPTRAGGS